VAKVVGRAVSESEVQAMARMTASRVGAALLNGVFPARRRAAAFAEVLDGSVHPSPGEQQALTAVAAELRSIPAQRTTTLSPEFRARLRQRLVAVATVQGIGSATPDADDQQVGLGDQPVNGHGVNGHNLDGQDLHDLGLNGERAHGQPPSGPPPSHRRPSGRHRRLAGLRRRAVAGLAACAVVAGLVGVASASTTALPGETLYGVKRTVESVRLSLSGSELDRGTLELHLAAVRLAEVENLVRGPQGTGVRTEQQLSRSTTALLGPALADMDESTRAGASRLLDVYEQQGTARPVAELEAFVRAQRTHLESLLPRLPADVRSDVGASLALLDRLLVRAESMLDRRAGEPGVGSGKCPQPCTPGGAAKSARAVTPSAGPSVTTRAPAAGPDPTGTSIADQVEPQPSEGTQDTGGSIDSLLNDLLGGGQSTSTPSPESSSSPTSSGLDGLVGKTLSDVGDAVNDTGL
jgi:hypothetical protein